MIDYFINGNKFSDLADFSIDLDNRALSLDLYKQNSIIFCKTDFLDYLFEYLKFSKMKYILISHMSDYPINELRFKKAPPSIIKWYAQNAIYDHKDLVPIPIGLGNHKGKSSVSWYKYDWFVENIEKLRLNPKDEKTLYCNWYSLNNPKQRVGILQKLRNNNIKYYWGRSCSEKDMENLVPKSDNDARLSFENYCEIASHYKFMVCPPGNGVAVHQPWEALYMGCIPIVLKHRIYENYTDLPIIQINDWSEVTYDLLNSYLDNEFNTEKMFMPYWRELIKKEFEKI